MGWEGNENEGMQLFFARHAAGSPVILFSMPRTARQAPGGYVYHVLNRAVAQRLMCLVFISVFAVVVSIAQSEQPSSALPGASQYEFFIQKKKKKTDAPPKKEEAPEPKKDDAKTDEPKKEDVKKEDAKKTDKDAPPNGKQSAAPKNDEAKLLPRDDRDRATALINRKPPEQRGKYLAILDIKDQGRLAKMALADSDALARHTAVYTLTDQKLLAKVAWESRDEMIQITAASRITGADQESIVKMFDKPSVGGVRSLVFEKLKDPPTLFRIAMEGDMLGSFKAANRLVDMYKAETAGVTDKLLEDIALGSKHEASRRAAIRVVTNQAVLAKVAEDPERKVRDAAAARLKELRGKKK